MGTYYRISGGDLIARRDDCAHGVLIARKGPGQKWMRTRERFIPDYYGHPITEEEAIMILFEAEDMR